MLGSALSFVPDFLFLDEFKQSVNTNGFTEITPVKRKSEVAVEILNLTKLWLKKLSRISLPL